MGGCGGRYWPSYGGVGVSWAGGIAAIAEKKLAFRAEKGQSLNRMIHRSPEHPERTHGSPDRGANINGSKHNINGSPTVVRTVGPVLLLR